MSEIDDKHTIWYSLNPKESIRGKKILPFLIHQAKMGEPITYGELAKRLNESVPEKPEQELKKRGWYPRRLTRPLGHIGKTIETLNSNYWDKDNEPIPPIQALVVLEATRIPGRGINPFLQTTPGLSWEKRLGDSSIDDFIVGYLKQKGSNLPDRTAQLSKSREEEIFEQIHEDIYDFNWDDFWAFLLEVLKQNGEDKTISDLEQIAQIVNTSTSDANYRIGPPPKPKNRKDNATEKAAEPKQIYSPRRGSYGGGGESEEHKKLKEFIANNPKSFPKSILAKLNQKGLSSFGETKDKIEYELKSKDKIDVFFEEDSLAVEVKASNSPEEDITRGLYQCVKYRSVLEAQRKVKGNPTKVNAALILEGKLTTDQKKVAKILDILVFEGFKFPK